MTEIKISLERLHSKFEKIKEETAELKDKAIEIVYSEKQKGKRISNGHNLRYLWNTTKHQKMFKGVPENKERQRLGKNI
jgi:hypothetical protein